MTSRSSADNISKASFTIDGRDQDTIKPTKLLKIRALVAGMLVNLLVGTSYNYSNINSYIAVHLKMKSEDTIVVQQIWLLFQSIFAILSVRFAEKIGYWKLNLIAFSAFSTLHFCISWVNDYYTYILIFGSLAGTSIGLGYLDSLYIAWTYYPKKKSVVTGAILFCTGMSASIFSPLTSWIVNPDNLSKKDPRYGERVPLLFRYLGLIYGSITLIACLIQPKPWKGDILKEKATAKQILKNDKNYTPEQIKLAQNFFNKYRKVKICDRVLNEKEIDLISKDQLYREVGAVGSEFSALISTTISVARVHDMLIKRLRSKRSGMSTSLLNGKQAIGNGDSCSMQSRATLQRVDELEEKACPSLCAALKSRSFLILVVMGYGAMIYSYFINSNWKEFYSKALPDVKDQSLSFVLSAGAIGNSSIRIITGLVLTKVKYRWVFLLPCTLAILGSFFFLTLLKSYAVGLVLIICAMSTLGANFTLFPSACTDIFGPVIGPKVYPYVVFIFALSSFSQFFLKKFFGNTNPDLLLYIFGALSIIAFIASFLLPKKPTWDLSKKEALEKKQKLEIKEAQRLHRCTDLDHEADYDEGVVPKRVINCITTKPGFIMEEIVTTTRTDTECQQLETES